MPGIGTLSLVTSPADLDFVNSRIKAPQPAIHFTPVHQNIFNEFSAVSELVIKKLDETGVVELENVGTFIRNNDGKIRFEPTRLSPVFVQPVTAERVIRQHAEHNILVGDRETTSGTMSEYLAGSDVKKDRWWIWAVAIAVVAIGLIVFNIVQNPSAPLGNNHIYDVKSMDTLHVSVQ